MGENLLPNDPLAYSSQCPGAASGQVPETETYGLSIDSGDQAFDRMGHLDDHMVEEVIGVETGLRRCAAQQGEFDVAVVLERGLGGRILFGQWGSGVRAVVDQQYESVDARLFTAPALSPGPTHWGLADLQHGALAAAG